MLSSLLLALTATSIPYIDVRDLKPNQKGVCISEWPGGQMREIPVTILGLQDATSPDHRTVLIRLEDPSLAGSGIVAGMSGSPVYVDGKLLGALAYGYAFSREPIGMVTPFSSMLEITPEGPPLMAQGGELGQMAALMAGKLAPAAVLPPLKRQDEQHQSQVAISGLPSDSSFSLEILQRMGCTTAQAGIDPTLSGVPGAGETLAIPLVSGDAFFATMGTVTARDGNTLWAFGHPMYTLGRIRMPAARGRVLAVHSSYQSSFKLYAIGATFGTVVADRAGGVLVTTEAPPPGVPVKVSISEPTGTRNWNFSIVETPLLKQYLVTFLVNGCLSAHGVVMGDASVQLDLTITLKDGRKLNVQQATRGSDAVARISAFCGSVVGFLEGSSYQHPPITAVEATLKREEYPAGAMIAEVLPSTTTIAPGDELTLLVRLRPYRSPDTTQRLILRVPQDIPAGSVDLVVAEGAAWSEYLARSQNVPPTSFAGQMEQVRKLESSTVLYAALETHERGVAMAGGSIPAAPPSWTVALAAGLGKNSILRLGSAFVTQTQWQAPYPLEGAFRIPLLVRPRQEGP